jgi:tetratricopeptide (TPR) repeat protein
MGLASPQGGAVLPAYWFQAMPEQMHPSLSPTPEQRRIAVQQYDHARLAIDKGNHDYAINLLQTCCRLDPSNLIYRKLLRNAQKTKYHNNLRGSWLAWLTTAAARSRLSIAQKKNDHRKVLEYGEQILSKNPWDVSTQIAMAQSAEKLGIPSTGVWILEQARQKNPHDVRVNRALAKLLEKAGLFKQAIQMWDLVAKANPQDHEAVHKLKDLAATDTIVRGRYQEATAENEPTIARETHEPGGTPPSAAATHLARQLEPLQTRLAADPRNPTTYLRIAEVYRTADLHDKAREILRQGLDAANNDFEIHMALLDLEIEPFRHNLRITEGKLLANPQDEMLQLIRVQLLKEINSREQDLYRRRADRFPSDAAARLELGIRLLRSEQADEAIQELQQARKEPRCRWRALMFLGHCFQAKKNKLLARRNFAEALQHLPADQEAARKELLFQLACSAAEDRDWDEAIKFGLELANIDYTYRDIGKLFDSWQAGRHPVSPAE